MLLSLICRSLERKFPRVAHISSEQFDLKVKKERSDNVNFDFNINRLHAIIIPVTCSTVNMFKRFLFRAALVLDCREATEFNVSRIPGAFNLPFTQFKDQAGSQVDILGLEVKKHLGREVRVDEEMDVICYCSVGYRSSVIAERILDLREEGHLPPGVEPYNLRGSIFQWASEGRNLTRTEFSDGRGGDCVETQVTTVHPFSRVWGSLTLPFSLWKWD